jgi:hypothetical protein
MPRTHPPYEPECRRRLVELARNSRSITALARETQFKHWTPNDIVAHLHMGNYAADLSLKGGDEFTAFGRRLAELGRNTAGHLDAPTPGSAESKTTTCFSDARFLP